MLNIKKMNLILFFSFTFYSLILSTQDCFPQSQFQLVIRDSSNTGIEARSIIQTADGGFIAAGETGINGDIYIVKLNSSGQMLWSKTIGGIGQDIALSVVQTNDGGFIAAGRQSTFTNGIVGPLIVKFNNVGTIEWSKVLVDGFGDAAYSIVQTIDGGYAVATSPAEGGGTFRMVFIKLNSACLVQWSKNIEGDSYIRSIQETTDRGFILAGATRSFGAGGFDMFVVKVDSNGTLQWAKTIGGTNYDFAYSIVQTNDGGYAVAGRTASFGSGDKMYIIKLNNSGILQWSKVFSVFLDRAYSITQTNDGGYAIAGYTGGGGSMLILKLNPDGTLQWSRVVNGGSVQTYAYSILQTTDGGYAAAGYGGIFSATGMYIVKFDNNGNTCANTISHNISADSGGIFGNPIPTITNITINDTTLTFPTATHGFVTPICVIGIQPVSNEIPASYKLYQNFPNPFNPVTIIKFDIASTFSGSEFLLQIYDMLGREIAVLVNQSLHSGTYHVEWDGTNYASGIYYYKLSVLNSISSIKFNETKRMVLIK